MSEKRTRRGRPKGSGIDDRAKLDAIARLIADNPELKPTTAIRTLGISDPSVIRRLRDKFNAVRPGLMQDLKSGKLRERRAASAKPVSAPSARQQTSRAIAASVPATPTRVAPPAQSSNATTSTRNERSSARAASRAAAMPKPRIKPADDDSDRVPAGPASTADATQLFTTLFSAGVAATNTLMAAHTTLAKELIRSPYMSLALRQQLAFSEWAVGLVPAFQVPSKTAT